MLGGRPTDDPKPTLVAVRLAARQMRVLKVRAKREGIGLSEAIALSVSLFRASVATG